VARVQLKPRTRARFGSREAREGAEEAGSLWRRPRLLTRGRPQCGGSVAAQRLSGEELADVGVRYGGGEVSDGWRLSGEVHRHNRAATQVCGSRPWSAGREMTPQSARPTSA
jgi:hypothetical protein